ncbi:MAG TPA: hypothetical protein VI452_05830 [Marmoricola sp.]
MLTSKELTERAFTRTRRRDGYELAEVDTFLIEVAKALSDRDARISELQGDLTALRLRTREPESGQSEAAQGEAATAVKQASSAAAARLLEIAAASADQLAAESSAQAESLLATARAEADELVTAARAEAERVAFEMAGRKEKQTAELEEQRAGVLAEVSSRKAALEAEIEGLRKLEGDYREHLHRHLTEQLARLEELGSPQLRAVAD